MVRFYYKPSLCCCGINQLIDISLTSIKQRGSQRFTPHSSLLHHKTTVNLLVKLPLPECNGPISSICSTIKSQPWYHCVRSFPHSLLQKYHACWSPPQSPLHTLQCVCNLFAMTFPFQIHTPVLLSCTPDVLLPNVEYLTYIHVRGSGSGSTSPSVYTLAASMKGSSPFQPLLVIHIHGRKQAKYLEIVRTRQYPRICQLIQHYQKCLPTYRVPRLSFLESSLSA